MQIVAENQSYNLDDPQLAEFKRYFYKAGNAITVGVNTDVNHPERTSIGDNVIISRNCSICINIYGFNQKTDYNILIDSHSYIGRNTIIESFNKIQISKYVIIGPNVYISDNNHEYKNFKVTIQEQGLINEANIVFIKDGAWIGVGANIIGNLTIGSGSIIAANSFVNKDIPDHCIAAGSPAKIIKVCDYNTENWIDVKDNDELLNKIITERGIFKGYDYYRK